MNLPQLTEVEHFTHLQNFYVLDNPGKYLKAVSLGWWKMTYLTGSLGHPHPLVTKATAKNHLWWMLKEEHILYFHHSPRFVLHGGTLHGQIWINWHTGPKLAKLLFLVSFQPWLLLLHPFSLLILPQSCYSFCHMQCGSRAEWVHNSHTSTWLLLVYASVAVVNSIIW